MLFPLSLFPNTLLLDLVDSEEKIANKSNFEIIRFEDFWFGSSVVDGTMSGFDLC